MKHLDYKLVSALDAVISTGSFETAAQTLHITQSAVSQRIRELEKRLAQPLLIRSQPPMPTETGRKLLGLYRRVQLLEQDVLPELCYNADALPYPTLSLAANADSVASWLIPALADTLRTHSVSLDLVIADESRTLDLLRKGEVIGAISLDSHTLPGCRCDRLGRMDYRCVATPAFIARYFPEGITHEALRQAPAAVYDYHDTLHQTFFQQHFAFDDNAMPSHTARSSEAFIKLACEGLAYCLIPDLMIRQALETGILKDVTPGLTVNRHLYWHRWALETDLLKRVSRDLVRHACEVLA
ncbi:LysR family transcriptional regulator ArgP [Kistimonas asteriae]|uniref:LysR family transcriptional regulator ArgP n=1 Tax=Kistimonas asteriae TaxID=517724 RepID=UPI001BA86D3E|nr:LysR family transcriptional regulator ArgP [Kistimonas asteriae]